MHQKLYITSEQCNSMLLLNRKKKKKVYVTFVRVKFLRVLYIQVLKNLLFESMHNSCNTASSKCSCVRIIQDAPNQQLFFIFV